MTGKAPSAGLQRTSKHLLGASADEPQGGWNILGQAARLARHEFGTVLYRKGQALTICGSLNYYKRSSSRTLC